MCCQLLRERQVGIVGAKYDIATGDIELLSNLDSGAT